MKLTPMTMTKSGGKIVDASRKLWSLYQDMEYLYYQGVDIVRNNPENPDWNKVAELYGYSEPEQAQMLFGLLQIAQEQVRSEELNGKPNALIAIMWKVES